MAKKKANSSESPKEEKQSNEQEKGIISKDISSQMEQSFLDYAMSVITDRALPDVRDGLKPVHRRILYAMHGMGLTSSAKFRKSATVVGEVLGKYHPHGDTAVYEAMVKMSQDFTMRYPLVLGQGNFGSIDGDSPAAMRYTEAKMSKLASELLFNIEKDTVDFLPNYDGTTKEPSVLPAAVPNILLNGTLGIAVGMATNIPPHNLGEVVDAVIHLIDNKDATTDDLLKYIQGPDFPLGGVIFDKKAIKHAYANGRGGIVCRGQAEIVEAKSGSFQIIISSLPFRVNKADLIVKIADLHKNKKIQGIKGLRDESTTIDNLRVVIDLKVGTHPQKVLNYIYKHTQLESTFNMNMVMLVDGVPQTMALKSILQEFISHRQEVVKRRTQFDLNKAEAREHILLGLKKALDHIDKIIKTIKASKDTPTAQANLMKKFKFTEIQAKAILEMKLQKLAGLERKKIEDELKEIQAFIKEMKALLKSPKKILTVIKKELEEVVKKYGDERRTKVMRGGVKSISVEDLIPEEESVLVYSAGGYVKRTNPDEFKKQRRGGIGVVDLKAKEEDFVSMFLTTSTHSDLLFFSDRGKVYQIKMYDLPEGRRATRGKSIMNFLQLEGDEKVTSILAMPKDVKKSDSSLAMITRNGVVKKVATKSFYDVRRSGLIAIKLKTDDELITARFVEKNDDVVMASHKGQSIRFKESDVREMGRTAGGVVGMKLKKGDFVVGANVVKKGEKDPTLFVISENGYGKQTALKEYKVQKRAGSGIKTMQVTSKTGDLIISKVLTENEQEIIAISKNGQVIRVDVKELPSLGRQTQGVRIMKLRAGDSIASLTCL